MPLQENVLIARFRYSLFLYSLSGIDVFLNEIVLRNMK